MRSVSVWPDIFSPGRVYSLLFCGKEETVQLDPATVALRQRPGPDGPAARRRLPAPSPAQHEPSGWHPEEGAGFSIQWVGPEIPARLGSQLRDTSLPPLTPHPPSLGTCPAT